MQLLSYYIHLNTVTWGRFATGQICKGMSRKSRFHSVLLSVIMPHRAVLRWKEMNERKKKNESIQLNFNLMSLSDDACSLSKSVHIWLLSDPWEVERMNVSGSLNRWMTIWIQTQPITVFFSQQQLIKQMTVFQFQEW